MNAEVILSLISDLYLQGAKAQEQNKLLEERLAKLLAKDDKNEER
jgi:hypothetical protein